MDRHISSKEILLSADAIKAALRDQSLDIRIYETLDSTNNEARRKCGSIKQKTLFISEEQSAGKGRLDRSFYSPKNTGIYMSLAFQTDIDTLNHPMRLTMKAAVAVAKALEKLEQISPGIKWVNDIYYQEKKICGILVEGVLGTGTDAPCYAIVGIGINTSTASFPSDIEHKAASIGSRHSRNEIIAAVLNELLPLYEDMENLSFLEEYKKRSIVTGRTAVYEDHGKTVRAKIAGIADDGGLIVQRQDGKKETITAGTVEMDL